MARCFDCFHCDACKQIHKAAFPECTEVQIMAVMSRENSCKTFKPTADVVEVVRCRDCNVPHNKWLGCPNLNGMIPPPDFYCARGERRANGEK